jgi:hypothetical protein
MKYDLRKTDMDGKMALVGSGAVPTNLCNALMDEWSAGAGRKNINRRLEQAVYVGASDGAHPRQVQQLLDYVSK